MSLTLECVNEKIENCKEDIREIKQEVKELGKLYSCFEVLNESIKNLALNTQKSISDTNDNIKELADLFKKQSENITKNRIETDKKLEERDRIIEEIRNRPEREAYEQKKYWSKEVGKKIFSGIVVLLLLGFGFFMYQQNADLRQQISIINQK